MKYEAEDYIDTGIYMDDEDMGEVKEKIVKCRRTHKCASCQKEIKVKEKALLQTAFFDGKPVSCHTCLECVEKWIEETGQVESEVEK